MKNKVLLFTIAGLFAISLYAQDKPSSTGSKESIRNSSDSQKSLQAQPTQMELKIDPAQVAQRLNRNFNTDKTMAYDTTSNDPFKVRSYKLSNGLRVFIAVNKDAPRIQTMIAIKAGSKFDPKETTGLAHYLEHMVFKGTESFGTLNWEKEKVLLDSISANFEYHKAEKDEAKKKTIYARIDSFSHEASKYAIPNEYDKMVTSLGASGTNAFTSTDMTVYLNDIPSNALDKFLMLESNRFQSLVLRLFHTELETVYEEFNRSQDNDRRWSYQAIMSALLPNHPYGTQTTIGEGEHLKNPSMVNIHNYFNTYYRPNNAAIILVGDVDPDNAIAQIKRYFGGWQTANIPPFKSEPAPVVKEPIIKEYTGPQPEHIYLGYLFNGANSRDALLLKLTEMILSNGNAGLIDLNLVQQQKVLQAYGFVNANADYCFHMLYAEPKQGQKLEELKDLLLAEVEKLKKGEFGDWVLPAIIDNLKLQRMKAAEENSSMAGEIMTAFVHNIKWEQWTNEIDMLSSITKQDVIDFANKHYGNNYAVCYKRMGEANVHKVEKPAITPVVMNKEDISEFKKKWDGVEEKDVAPKFIDFNEDILRTKLGKTAVPFDYIKNEVNKTFNLNYIYDMGTDHIRELGLAAGYLEYLGTDKYTAEQLKTEFYKFGLSFSVTASRDRVQIVLSGLEENLDKGIALLEHLLANVKPNQEVYNTMVDDILQSRLNAKKNKNAILYSGLVNYAKHGSVNPFNDVLSEDELKKMNIQTLVALIKSLNTYKHKVFYYGNLGREDAGNIIGKHHIIKGTLKDYPAKKTYKELPIKENEVLVCYYPMKQAEVVLLAKDETFNRSLMPFIYLYNDYYGSGLSSIMFQEIREKMALAYSVYSSFGVPQYADQSHYITSYVGTQADKLATAVTEMQKLLNQMPIVEQQFNGAKMSVRKSLQTDWITRDAMYWVYDRALKRGLDDDIRKEIYYKLDEIDGKQLASFFNTHIKGKAFKYLVIGKKDDINLDSLKAIGPVREVSLTELFGY